MPKERKPRAPLKLPTLQWNKAYGVDTSCQELEQGSSEAKRQDNSVMQLNEAYGVDTSTPEQQVLYDEVVDEERQISHPTAQPDQK